MSCLMLSELPLSDQIAIELAMAEKLAARTRHLLPSLDSAVDPVSPPCVGAAVESIPLSTAENAAMVEQEYRQHPPLQVCAPGHRPRMYQATGNREVRFYVECPLCNVKTAKRASPEIAAKDWTQRDVQPIHIHTAAVA
ncbi:MAG: hypothetical protein WA777_17640 [Rhodanobacter sp.]